MDTDRIKSILNGLEIGAQFATGQDKIRLLNAKGTLQSLVTGRFVDRKTALEAYQKRVYDLTLEWMASEVMLVLEKSIEYFTATQYRTLRELAKDRHPYATRHYNGRFRSPLGRFTSEVIDFPGGGPQFVNRQDYRGTNQSLSLNFNYNVARNPGGTWSVVAYNPVPHAGLLVAGTDKMIARPYDRAAVDKTRSESTGVIRDAAETLRKAGIDPSGLKMPTIDFVLGNVRRQYT